MRPYRLYAPELLAANGWVLLPRTPGPAGGTGEQPMAGDGKVSGSQAALSGAAGQFNKQVPAIARLVEQVTANQHVDTGDGSLDGLVSSLVSAVVTSLGEFGENGVQAGATLLSQQAKNFHSVGNDVQSGQPSGG
jgi:hypothetical protein